MHKARYSFTRSEGLPAILNKNRASTDALNALQEWLGGGNRFYDVQQDEDNLLVADLKFEQNDKRAGPDLDNACQKHGVGRIFVSNLT